MDKKILICWNKGDFGDSIENQIEKINLSNEEKINKLQDEIEEKLRMIPRVSKNEQKELRNNIDKQIKEKGKFEKKRINAELCYSLDSLKEKIGFNTEEKREKIEKQIKKLCNGDKRDIEKLCNDIKVLFKEKNRNNIEEKVKGVEEKLKKLCDDEKGIEKLISNIKELNSKNWTKLTGIIVLCELKWENKAYSNMYGIELVQQYIRTMYSIRLPVLFVSFLKYNEIIAQNEHVDKRIISTPALKHDFICVLEPIEEWIEKIINTGPMSKLDLNYTVKNFCNKDGLVRTILHSITGNSSLDAIKEQIRTLGSLKNLMDEQQTKKYQGIKQMCNGKNNIEDIKKEIRDICYQLSPIIEQVNDESQKQKERTVFYIDDEFDTDPRIIDLQKEATEKRINFIIHKNPAEIKKAIEASDIRNFQKALNKGVDFFKGIDVVICDIEIWDKPIESTERLLVVQGYKFIEKLISLDYRNKQYLLLTNCTRDLYSSIINSLKNVNIDIDIKERVLGSKEARANYIYKIRDLIENEIPKSSMTIIEIFNNYIHNPDNYEDDKKNNFLTLKVFGNSDKYYEYSDIEKLITEELKKITDKWDLVCNEFPNLPVFREGEKYKKMKENINRAMLGGELRQIRNFKYDSDELGKFVQKLILRRFVMYVAIGENKSSFLRDVSIKDACYAISSNEKCYTTTLNFSSSINPYYFEEEIKYAKSIGYDISECKQYNYFF